MTLSAKRGRGVCATVRLAISNRPRNRLGLMAALGLAVVQCHAAHVRLEDFNELSLGPINGQRNWVDSAGNGRVVSDPADPANQVLALTNTSACVFHALGALTISNASVGTLYFRMRWPGTGFSIYSGLTDVAAPGATSDLEAFVRCEPVAPALLKVRDAGAYDAVARIESNVWYQVWIVANNASDLYSVHLQGGSFASQAQLSGLADGETWFTFRNTSGDGANNNSSPKANRLLTFNLRTASGHVGPFLVDDVYVDPTAMNLSDPRPPLVDPNPPVIVGVNPPAGTTQKTLNAVTVIFSEPVSNTAAAHFLVNGVPATNVTGSGATRTWQFPSPAAGSVNISWDTNHTITDLASNRFDAGSAAWSYTCEPTDVTPPVISALSPPAGTILSNLTSVTVTFTEPVTVVEAADLLANGIPATEISGSGSQRTFTFSQPRHGVVQFAWDGSHAISDAAGNRFNETVPAASWSYTLLDKLPPAMVSVFPAPGAAVGALTNIEVTFSEPVTGLDASDLRISGTRAITLVGAGAGPFIFTTLQPPDGAVAVNWAAGHGIQDLAAPPNSFGGGSWSYALSPSASTPDVVLNEILADNLNGLTDEDGDTPDWIELQNRGAGAVDLTGWSLTDDPAQAGKWVFPTRTLPGGQFLVVYASGKNRAPTTPGTNLHTNFKLGAKGYLGLFNAELPRRVVSEFAPQYPDQRGDVTWGRTSSNTLCYLATPTPGASNYSAATFEGVLDLPAASSRSGFFNLPFTVALSSRTRGVSIFYTLDGSPPTTASPLYTGPIPVAGTPSRAVVTLRAIAVLPGWLSSPVLTRTFIFPDLVATQPALPTGFPAIWDSPCSAGGNCRDTAADYEMDPQVVTNGNNAALIRQALTAIPSVSIVTRVDLLFGPAQGVYVRREDSNQQPINVEFLEPDGTDGFQADCGLEVQGGTSPTDAAGDWKSKALSLRLIFRGDFGPVTKLRYALFPGSPVEEFNTLLLDAGLNFTWHHMTDADQRNRADYVRDQYTSDLMNALGIAAPRGRFVHLYLNGLYWGLYGLHERADESFFADHFGGDKSEYDILKHTGTAAGLQNGSLAAWNAMMAAAHAGLADPNAYDTFAVEHLDVPWFIDYMLVNLWAGNTDWAHHNWYAGRRRLPGAQWRFVSWDAEHVLKNVNENRVGVNNVNGPGELFQLLRTNAEFAVAFGDRVHRHCFNGGAFNTDAANPVWSVEHPERNRPADTFMKRVREIDPSIVAESARWGDVAASRTNQPYTRDVEWLREINSLLGLTNSAGNTVNYFPQRNATVLEQLRAASLYPAVAAPAFSQHGGRVAAGHALFLTNMQGDGTVYFTTNGVDPRIYGSGAVAAQALTWTGAPVALGQTMVVRARCLAGVHWSALNEADFVVAPMALQLAVTELMYHPPGGDPYEFIEIRNLGTTAFDAGNCSFQGIDYCFPSGTKLAPGQLVVLANNADPAAFAARYPGVSVFGWFGAKLDNGGERIALRRPTGEILFSLDYDDDNGWPTEADGAGFSLEIIDPAGDPDAPANWRATTYLGTPGTLSAGLPPGAVQFSEVMAWNLSAVSHAGAYPDWIELYNGSAFPVSLAGWSLSDDGNARKFVFPPDTILDEGDFLTVWCDTNTALPGVHAGFALDRTGETLSLFNAATTRVDSVTFGLQVSDLSLGRVGPDWTLTLPTFGAPNVAAPTAALAHVFLNEWLANAAPGGSDWVELFNAASLPVSLRGAVLIFSNDVHQIRSLSYLGPCSHWQLFADEAAGADHLDFKLSAAGGTLMLCDALFTEQDRVTFGPQAEGVSEGRLPDGSTTVQRFTLSPSPGVSNYVATFTGPLLNEVLALNCTMLTDLTGQAADWVELFNPGAGEFDLSGYRLGVKSQPSSAWVFPPGVTVPGYGHLLVLFCDHHPASTNLEAELHTGHALSDGGDAVYLFNPQAQVVDGVEFGLQAPDLSIGRVGDQWRLLAVPTAGQSNTAPASLGSPGGLRLNEWVAAPLPGQEEFFEVFNPDALPVELSGLFLTDDLSLAGRTRFQIAPLSFVGPRGFAVFKADGDPSLGRDHVNFRLDMDAESLRIYDTNLAPVDTSVLGLQAPGVSEGRWPDGATTVMGFSCPTPGASNGGPSLTITSQPRNQTVLAGGMARFCVTVFGAGPLTFQWSRNTVSLAGAANATLVLPAVGLGDAADYQVVIANICSTLTSAVATLTVVLPPQLGAPTLDGEGFEFLLLGQPGEQYSIEKSTNLLDWTILSTVTPTNGSWPVRDATATLDGTAFYRARLRLQ